MVSNEKGGTMFPINVPFVNRGGEPYLEVSNIKVGTTSVDLALGYANIMPVGKLLVRIGSAIPSGTMATLPITLTLNGNTRNLTYFNGTEVTAGDLTGTGVLEVFNDKFNGILQLLSTPTPTTD